MATAAALYTPEVLALATGLAAYPLSETLKFKGSARSSTCGSSLELGLSLDGEGRIAQIGLRTHACAIGQAAAAIFAEGALGQRRAEIEAAKAELRDWLRDGSSMPDWPGLSAIDRARNYPARHGAILLAWNAALEALPS